MKYPVTNLIFTVTVFLALVAWASPGQELLHPRGDLSAEQIKRLQENPPDVIRVDNEPLSPAEIDLLEQLHLAKEQGQSDSAMQLEQRLAELRGKPLEFVSAEEQDADQPQLLKASDRFPAGGEKWLPHEYLLAGDEMDEFQPEIVAASDGVLYAAYVEDHGTDGYFTTLSISHDGGEHWSWRYKLLNTSSGTPSLAIGEGGENRLFLVFQTSLLKSVEVFRLNLDDLTEYSFATVYSYYDNMVANPRITTDSDEYGVWYMYVVFNAQAVDNWVILHSRTLDYGATWTVADIIGGYCGYPGEFYDGREAHPDIEFGSQRLYMAFDNYPAPCVSTDRDVLLLISEDFGASWGSAIELAATVDDEHHPAIAAVKNHIDEPTAAVAWTRYYQELDNDVWVRHTVDGGQTWSGSGCIACSTPEERFVNLAASPSEGLLHAAYWDEANLNYAWAPFDAPYPWARQDSLSTSNTAAEVDLRPGLLVDPTRPVELQAGIAWTDTRNQSVAGLDIYYDAAMLAEPPDNYYLYGSFNPGVGPLCGVDGFVDEYGQIEGIPGAEYVIFTGGAVYSGEITAYIYRVETAGDPETHPDNPDNTGPINPRTYTFVSSHYMGNYGSAHDNAFYVDETGIYYGASDNGYDGDPGWATLMGGAIWRWDFQWNLLECVVTPAAPGTQTLARNDLNGDWWAGSGNRRMYKWDGTAWVYQFTAPHLGGGHHDGLEIIENSLYVSDMTSDAIQQFRLDNDGNLMDPPTIPYRTFYYTASPSVEGLGFEPNGHIWFTGGGAGLFEIGGGDLQVSLSGIPDQCITPGEGFAPFDLDGYVVGEPPFTWSFSGAYDLDVVIDGEGIVLVSYPYGWTGQEAVTFRVVDGLGRIASDLVVFTVSPIPVVGDIPDQTAPFVPFDLDDYLLDGVPELVHWTASGMNCVEVEIDPVTHVASVTFPDGCIDAEAITFRAFIPPCDDIMSDQDEAVFDPGITGVPGQTLTAFALGHPVPNPCISSTQVSYSIPAGGLADEVSLAVYDLAGRRIRTLVGSDTNANPGLVSWDCRNDRGQPVPSGVYFIQLNWNRKHLSEQVVLIR